MPEGLPEAPGEVLGLSGLIGEREGSSQEVARPLPGGVLVGLGEGGAAPFPSPSLSFPPSFLVGLGKGSPTPTGRRTPPLSLARLGQPASPLLLYIQGQGGASRHT